MLQGAGAATDIAAASGLPPAADGEDTTESYRGFGSFHSDNVEELIALPDHAYTPPAALPEWARSFGIAPPPFGAAMRAALFRLDPTWTFINHGAFGAALIPGTAVKRQYEDLLEEQPLAFVDRKLLPLLVFSIRRLASFLGARPQDIALVANATFGLNAAINTLVRRKGTVVAYLDTEYGSVWKMMRERCHAVEASLHEVPLIEHFTHAALMGDDDAVCDHIVSKLPEGCSVFVVDHIASTSAIALPVFTHLIPRLKKAGVKHILVDGAHGPLQMPLDLEGLPEEQRPTFYVGNLHKWVAAPKAVGFIWAHPSVQKRTHSCVVSHGSRAGFVSEFIWDGTKDYGAYLSVPAVVDFWATVGVDAVRTYSSGLLRDAEQLLCGAFRTVAVPRGAPFMKLVPLPPLFERKSFSAKYIQDTLHARYRVEVPIKDINGALYARISCFVYNTLAEYERLRDAVLDMESVLRKRVRDDDAEQAPAPPRPKDSRVDCGGCGAGAAVGTTRLDDTDDDDA